MLNEKAVFSLISRREYEAVDYLLKLIDKANCKDLKNVSCRNNEVSEARKIIIKAIIDKYPEFKTSIISKNLNLTVQGIREAYRQANIFYSNDGNFARKFDNFIQ
jgi:hypothetical protein